MDEQVVKTKCKCNCNAAGRGIYGLAFIGALVYYVQQATTFSVALVGFFKGSYLAGFADI